MKIKSIKTRKVTKHILPLRHPLVKRKEQGRRLRPFLYTLLWHRHLVVISRNSLADKWDNSTNVRSWAFCNISIKYIVLGYLGMFPSLSNMRKIIPCYISETENNLLSKMDSYISTEWTNYRNLYLNLCC